MERDDSQSSYIAGNKRGSRTAGEPAKALGLAVLGLLWILTGIAPALAVGPDPPAAVRRTRLEVIYSTSLFRTVSRNDALAAMRVWLDVVGRRNGFQLDANVDVAESLAELKKRVEQGPASLVLLTSQEYFELSGLGLLEPAFVGALGKTDEPIRFLLLARQESGVTAVTDLRGRNLAVYASSRADLGRKWIDVLLHEKGLGPADRFFSAIESVPTPSAAALPVFFGKAGAGIVDRSGFEVMKEMNPQLGDKLRVLATTPPLVDGILCVHKKHVEFREELLKALRELHQDSSGRQILMVFKAHKLNPVDTQALEWVRGLLAAHRRLSGSPDVTKGPLRTQAGRAEVTRPGGEQ